MSLEVGEKLQVLLAEYNSLRAEILERNTVLNQFLTVSVTGGIAIVTIAAMGHGGTRLLAVLLFVLVPPIIWAVFKILEFDTKAAATRVRELESTINRLAGEKLLVWENNSGLYKVDYVPRFREATRHILIVLAAFLLIAVLLIIFEPWLLHHLQAVTNWLRSSLGVTAA